MPRMSASSATHIYLLRCWHEDGGHPPPDDGWRFSLEDPHTGLRRGFPNLTALVAALEQATAKHPAADEASRAPA